MMWVQEPDRLLWKWRCKAPDGVVYAVEKNEEAVALLGEKPSGICCRSLEDCSRKSAGGTGKIFPPRHMYLSEVPREISKKFWISSAKKNKAVRVVINAITLETVTEALTYLKEQEISGAEVVSVQTARAREVGRYHMMTGQNPVYVISFGGERQER